MPFGWTQVKKETPRIIKNFRDTLVYTVAGSLPFAKVLADKWGMTVEDYAMYAGLVILLSKAVAMLFGVKDEQAVAQSAYGDAGPGGSQNPPDTGGLPPKP